MDLFPLEPRRIWIYLLGNCHPFWWNRRLYNNSIIVRRSSNEMVILRTALDTKRRRWIIDGVSAGALNDFCCRERRKLFEYFCRNLIAAEIQKEQTYWQTWSVIISNIIQFAPIFHLILIDVGTIKNSLEFHEKSTFHTCTSPSSQLFVFVKMYTQLALEIHFGFYANWGIPNGGWVCVAMWISHNATFDTFRFIVKVFIWCAEMGIFLVEMAVN